MSTDQEWARDLFERSRQGEEPVWFADHAAMMRSGRRRSRIRALTASGSVVLTAAVVVAVGIGVAGGVDQKTPAPGPGHGVAPPSLTNTPAAVPVDPSKVLDYAAFGSFSTNDNKASSNDYFKKYFIAVPNATAIDAINVLSQLDPTFSHIAGQAGGGSGTRVVPDNDPMAEDMALLTANVLWTDNGMSAKSLRTAHVPTGNLSLRFANSANAGMSGADDCGADSSFPAGTLHPVQAGNGWTDAAQWSPCVKTTLRDTSVLESTTKTYGSFSVISVVRHFPEDGGQLQATWWNYASPTPVPGSAGATPDPKTVLSPSPVTAEKLRAALSDSSLVPPLSPVPVVRPPSTMLQASDFGPGWAMDPARTNGTTGDLVVDDGCVNEQHPLASTQPIYAYVGTTPSGLDVTADAQVDVVPTGTGPSLMADLLQHGTGGCTAAGLPYDKDTMSPLPAGTGDEAFIENWYGQGNETFFIRFGDDIMRVDVTTPDQKVPTFTQADREWFLGLAEKAAARHAGKG